MSRKSNTFRKLKVGITCELSQMQKLVSSWQQRNQNCEDLDYYLSLGGDNWLLNNLLISPENGIKKKSIPERIEKYGSNSISDLEPPCKF